MANAKLTRSILSVEALEARQLLATSVTQPASHVVSIVGNTGVDLVFIEQNDDTNQLIIRTNTQRFERGERMETFVFNSDEIRRLDIRLGDGNDRVEYKQVGNLFNRKTFNVNMGGGNDRVDFDFGLGYQTQNPVTIQQVPVLIPAHAEILPDNSAEIWVEDQWVIEATEVPTAPAILAPVRVQIQGGSGDDTVNANFGGIASTNVEYRAYLDGGNDTATLNLFGDVLAGSEADFRQFGGAGDDSISTGNVGAHSVMAGAYMTLRAEGGVGNDELSLSYYGLVDGELNLMSEGNQGDDTVGHIVTVTAPSIGTVESVVLGNSGDDTLTHIVEQEIDINLPQSMANLIAMLNGGAGDDISTTNLGVSVFDVETQNIV